MPTFGRRNISRPLKQVYPRLIDGSLMFDNTSVLQRTNNQAPTDGRLGVISMWVKLSLLKSMYLFDARSDDANRTYIYWNSNATWQFYNLIGNVAKPGLVTVDLSRDETQWAHVYWRYNSLDPVPNAEKNYIAFNGVRITNLNTPTYPAQNDVLWWSKNGQAQVFGGRGNLIEFWDGPVAEAIFIDGSNPLETELGQYNDFGAWVPNEDLSGLAYGNNGSKLEFLTLIPGEDTSGNNNNWTPNGIGSYQLGKESPTNVFYSWASTVEAHITKPTFGYGNLSAISASGVSGCTTGAGIIPDGALWYFESKADVSTGVGVSYNLGFCNSRLGSPNGGWLNGTDPYNCCIALSNNAVGVYNGTTLVFSNVGNTPGNTVTKMALDLINRRAWFGLGDGWYKADGTLGADPAAGTDPTIASISVDGPFSLYALCHGVLTTTLGSGGFQLINGGFTDENGYGIFDKQPPTGFLACCTQNILPLIDEDIIDGEYAQYVKTRAGVTISVTNNNSVIHSITNPKFGASSALFNGVNQYLTTSKLASLRPLALPFCVRGWFKFNSLTADSDWVFAFNTGNWAAGSSLMNTDITTSKIQYTNAIAGSISVDWTADLLWHHIAFVRQSDNALRIYLDGVDLGGGTEVYDFQTNVGFDFGWLSATGNPFPNKYFNGQIDDLEVLLGDQVYTENFTPPERINTRSSYTKWLIQSRDMPNGNTAISDHDIISDVKFPVEDDKAISIGKVTNISNSWWTARKEKKVLALDDPAAEVDAYNYQVEFITNLINGVALGNNSGISSTGNEYFDWIMNGQDPTKYGIEVQINSAQGGGAVSYNHNGGKPPSMLWRKRYDGPEGWRVFHKYTDVTNPNNYRLELNSASGRVLDSGCWGSIPFTSTQWHVGASLNVAGRNYVDILFFDIPFLQSAFRFDANVNIDGPNIILDHKTNLIFIKQYLATSNWTTKFLPQGNNPITQVIYLDSPNGLAFPTGQEADIYATSYKIRNAGGTMNNGKSIGFSFGRFPGHATPARL